MELHHFKVIARIQTDFKTKFGIPRQSGLVEGAKGKIVFEPDYRNVDAVRGMEDFTHIWLIWQFSEAVREQWSPMVRPPRLGGNKRMGVFATRSPFRPNAIGLSCVRLERIEYTQNDGPVLHVSGVDLMNGTPIYDIKPYLPYADCHPEAVGGFASTPKEATLQVVDPNNMLSNICEEKRTALEGVLSHDPRPTYQNDPKRVYGMYFGGYEVKFKVVESQLWIEDVLEKTPD